MPKRFGNNIDQIFRNKLDNAEVNPSDKSWEAIQAQLAAESTSVTGAKLSVKSKISLLSAIAASIAILIYVNPFNAITTPDSSKQITQNLQPTVTTQPEKIVNKTVKSIEELSRINPSNKQVNNPIITKNTSITNNTSKQIYNRNKVVTSNENSVSSTQASIISVFNNRNIENFNNNADEVLLPHVNNKNSISTKTKANNFILPNTDRLITTDSENKKIASKTVKQSIDNNSLYNIANRNEKGIAALELSVLKALPVSINLKDNFKDRLYKRPEQQEHRFYVGLVYQYNISWQKLSLSNNYLREIEASVKTQTINGHSYGFSVNWLTKKNWEFEAQYIANTTLGGLSKITSIIDSEYQEAEHSVKYTYRQFPLIIKKRFRLTKRNNTTSKLNLGILAGVQYNQLVKAEVGLAKDILYEDIQRANEIGLTAGLELDLNLSKSLAFRLGSKITASNRPDALLQFHNSKTNSAYNMQASLTAGVIFRLK